MGREIVLSISLSFFLSYSLSHCVRSALSLSSLFFLLQPPQPLGVAPAPLSSLSSLSGLPPLKRTGALAPLAPLKVPSSMVRRVIQFSRVESKVQFV